MSVPRVLCIAGTDPTGGAGIQADLKSIAAQGGYGMAVVTVLVAQNTRGVREVHIPPVAFLAAQLDAVSDDVRIDAVKIGMLGSIAVIDTVAAWLDRVRPPLVVLDPVMVATSGDRLLDPAAEDALRALVSRVDLVTPNLPELAILADESPVADWAAARAQAARVAARHGVAVLAKGGHLGGADAPDALIDGDGEVEFPGVRIATTSTHGTGCSLSSAVATRLAAGDAAPVAVARAKAWLTESIAHGESLAVGEGHGPIHHFAGLWARGGLDTAPTPDAVADEWWRGIARVRADIDASPFVRALGDGTLPRDAFLWYLAQDALYLRDYARVLAEASRLAPTAEEQAFWAGSARDALVAELALHESWLPPSAVADTTAAPATVAYLDHMLAAAPRGGYPELVAALLPCYWLYQDAGERLQPLSHDAHPYRSWLDTYADPGFAASTTSAIGIATRVAAAADAATRARMRRAFEVSSAHELAFFRAPLESAEE